jgi:hypothetical protein
MARGLKTGGRRKGSLNKKTILRAQTAENLGLSPLEFLLSVVRDETRDIAVRLDAAKCAAPYVHARLQTTVAPSGTIQIVLANGDLEL